MCLGGLRLTRARGRSREDRGAAALEFALILPLLTLLLFGIIEFSLALRDHTVLTSNTRSAVRVAATGAAAGPATCKVGPEEPPCTPQSAPILAQEAADAVQRSGTSMPADYIESLMVYRANSQGFPGAEGNKTIPANCTSTPACVQFTWRDSADEFRYAGGTWASKSINACFPGTATAPQDRVGVYIRARHPFLTGMFGGGITMSERAVMDFEPLPSDSCRANEHP